jgi:hypothetical protein
MTVEVKDDTVEAHRTDKRPSRSRILAVRLQFVMGVSHFKKSEISAVISAGAYEKQQKLWEELMTPVVYQMFQFIKHNYKDEEFFKHSF